MDSASPLPHRPHHRTVDRIAALLDLIARSPQGSTLSHAAATLSAPVSSVQQLLNGLTATGFLVEQDRRYSLGLAAATLAMLSGKNLPWIDQRELDRLAEVAGTPLTLAIRIGAEAIYLAKSNSDLWPDSVHIVDDHLARPLLFTAAGRLLLAFAGSNEREDILRDLAVDLPAEVTAYRSALPIIRKQRLARSNGLIEPDIQALAIPVIEAGKVTAALVLFAPHDESSAAPPSLDRAARRVQRAWAEL